MATGTDATVNDLIERWLEMASPEWSPSTLVQTKSAIRTDIEPLLGPFKLKRLKAADLDRFYAELRKRPGRRSATLSPATSGARRRGRALHSRAIRFSGVMCTAPTRTASGSGDETRR